MSREVESLVPGTFELRRHGASRLAIRRDGGDGLERLVLAGPGARGGEPAFRGRGATERVPWDGGHAVFRRYRRGGLFRWLTRDRLFDERRPFAELCVTETARAAGVPTVEVLAVRVDPAGPGLWRGEIATRELPEAPDLVTWLTGDDAPTGRARRDAIVSIGRAVRRMHDAGIVHADLHVKNVLLRRDPDPTAFVIDFDRARVETPLHHDARLANLRRLDRSTVKFNLCVRPAISRADRVRFLRAYVDDAGDPRALDAWLVRGRAARYPWRVFRWRLTGAARKGA